MQTRLRAGGHSVSSIFNAKSLVSESRRGKNAANGSVSNRSIRGKPAISGGMCRVGLGNLKICDQLCEKATLRLLGAPREKKRGKAVGEGRRNEYVVASTSRKGVVGNECGSMGIPTLRWL